LEDIAYCGIIHPTHHGASISTLSSTTSPGGRKLPDTLFGYKVVSLVGEGAASTIYAVTDPAGQLYALKHVVKKNDADERFLDQLTNEFDMSRLFRHPCLRKVLELKVPRKFFSNKVNEAALMLEWVDGSGLEERVPADLQFILGVFAHCAAALASMHKLKLVHCDFKPNNVLITAAGSVKVIDFGQTCKLGTTKRRLQGTPDFIAPEQVKMTQVDAKTDIYSLGASLYWAITGQKAPTYLTVKKTERDIIKLQKFPSPRDLRPEVSEPLSDLIMHCLRYSPDRRPADMVTVLKTIEGLMGAVTG
jgi:serine/threonine-protein kinase